MTRNRSKRFLSELRDADEEALQRVLDRLSVRIPLYPLNPAISGNEAFQDWCRRPVDTELQMMAVRSESGHFRGCIRVENSEISYFVDPDHWGKGYGKKLVAWAMNNAQPSAHSTLRAIVSRENTASIRVLEDAGFHFAGITHQHFSNRTLLLFRTRLQNANEDLSSRSPAIDEFN